MLNKLSKFSALKNNQKIASLYYLGQEGFIFSINKTSFCIDPYLTNYVDKNCSNNVIKWERLYKSTVKGSDLKFVDYFLFTHTHFDHCDPWTIKEILKTNKTAKFIISKNNIKILASYGVDKKRILPASVLCPIVVNNIVITSIPAKHDVFHKNGPEFDELCFSISYKDFKLFHGGDTLNYPKLKKYAKYSDICLLPINGRDEWRTKNDIIGNLNPLEAFKLCLKSKSNILIPMHNDLYKINCCSNKELDKARNKYRNVNFKLLKHDEFIKVEL